MQYEKLNINLSNSSTKYPSFRNSMLGVQSLGVAACTLILYIHIVYFAQSAAKTELKQYTKHRK